MLVRLWLCLTLIAVIIHRGSAQNCAEDGSCDKHERCSAWAEEGECLRSPQYMKEHCPVSCRGKKVRVPRTQTECYDAHNKCPEWASLGECKSSTDVKRYCPKTCGVCVNAAAKDEETSDESCVDTHENCAGWADVGECQNNPTYMLKYCPKSCGSCNEVKEQQRLLDRSITESDKEILEHTLKFGEKQAATGNQAEDTMKVVRAMVDYMEKSDEFMALPTSVQEHCKNTHELCSFWAAIGECEANIAFMKVKCAPACKTCHLVDINNRCPALPDAVPGIKPGDLNKMFEKIVETAPGNRTLTAEERQQLAELGMTEYTVTVHSRPQDGPVTVVDIKTDKELPPWVITFDNFLTDEECDKMIEHGHIEGYKRSEDVGKQRFDGSVESVKSKGRTSENAWCGTHRGCREKEVPKRLHARIAAITGVPPENSEDFQILRYEIGQFYNTHHDFIPHQVDRQCGPRILTFFMYLSDVEEGGGTDFPDLGITVMPKKGRALLWPSVYNSETTTSDDRMMHQALPVKAGTKFAANGWIHLYDYQTPQSIGCN
ncbi:procollagen-proline dioxygenase [Nitzschia inconspicua]|uniref:Procollagen-proline dioxygenase n=1 Tax=Nitzschia inconspicua TaxID=303405 RepID=A0A9K3KHV2_9STRA|nr:procollagen-proline dioxygenase [Nitzschia inconspicua]